VPTIALSKILSQTMHVLFPFFFGRHEFLEVWQGVGGVLLCLLC